MLPVTTTVLLVPCIKLPLKIYTRFYLII
uniref:Uncharacterized protein n=1 Tax=Anguilla anguilla TaxID=7936 RepID=A0A0E9QHL8_ANGAN